MKNQHAPVRAFSLLAIVSMLAAGFPLLPFFAGTAQAGTALLEENWDLGGTSWTYSGVVVGSDPSPERAYGGVGSSLVVESKTNGQTVKAERNAGLNITGPGYVVSFLFRNDWSQSWSTSWFTMRFPNGGYVKLDPTHGDPHNRVRLYTNNSATGAFYTYADKTWYQAIIKVDFGNSKVRAEIRDPATGALLASSSSLNLPTGAGNVGMVSFEGTYTGSNPVQEASQPFNYDNFAIRLPDPPTTPSPLTATAGPGAGEIRLSWPTPSDDGGVPVLYYHVYRSTTAGGAATLVANTTSLTWADTGLGNGVTRYYTVKAVNAVGASPATNEASATTFDYPSEPRSFTATPGNDVGQIRLVWMSPASTGGSSITGYKIYRGDSSGNATFLIQVVGVTSYTDYYRPNGTRWYYNVTALNLVGEGPTSPEQSSLPKPDQAFPATGISISPSTGWTGDARTASFTYNVAVSQCVPVETCPVEHEWRVYQDGTPGGLDGTLLSSGTNTHAGHAETTSFPVTTTITPTGADGTHLLKVAVNTRTGSTQWALAGANFHLDAPLPGVLTGPSTPQLNRSTATVGMPIHVNASYDVFQKQCRSTDSCPILNEWMILFDGTLPDSPDGTLLASGNNSHPAHGTTQSYTISRSVTVPPTGVGPHYVKVAARADAASPWTVSAALLTTTPFDSGVLLFAPDLDNQTYVKTNGTMAYGVTNAGAAPVWAHGEVQTGPLGGHSGRRAWGTNLAGAYPALANGTLTIRDLDLRSASTATLRFWMWHATEPGVDGTRALIQTDENGPWTPLEPSTGPAYAQLRDGRRGWSGYTSGWQEVQLDLTPYAGHTVNLSFEFRSNGLENPPGGWFLDDLQLLVNGALALQDDFEGAWGAGGWTLTKPTTGPGSGYTTQNAWSTSPHAPYANGSRRVLELPRVNLSDDRATLTFWHNLKAEHFHDLAYLEISEDHGASWGLLEPFLGPAYQPLAEGKRGWSGNTLGWVQSTFDLAPYAGGRTLYARLVFESDQTVNDVGWDVSDFKIEAVRPGLAPTTSFGARTNQTAAFYAYFDHGGTNASFTTPTGKTITIRYTGTTNDVVARLAANGTLTARQAIVGPSGPTSIPTTDFIVTGGNWLGEQTTGTWTLRGAPGALSGTWGAVRLETGGKVFDDVATAGEPIEDNGLGRLSAQNSATLTWNWHNQQNARYDTTLTSQTTPEETSQDVRRFYEVDTDGDGFIDKDELNKNSDASNLQSTPTTDDDLDGLVNLLEQNRPAALDAILKEANGLVNTDLGEDWTRMRYHHITQALTKDGSFLDHDGDGIPNVVDVHNHAGEALVLVDNDPATSKVQLATVENGHKISVLVSPDWKHALLIAVNSGQPDTSSTTVITYDQFFQEVGAYVQANALDGMVERTLRQFLDATMTYHLVRKSGSQWTVSLTALNGVPADGTWTLLRDVSIPDFTLTVRGIALSAQHPALGALPALGAARVAWFFLDLHDTTTRCLSVHLLYRLTPCGSVPTTLGMRFYGQTAHGKVEGLLAHLREEYRLAGLLPLVYQTAPQVATLASSPETPGRWGPTPAQALDVPADATLALPQGTLATADEGAPNPRLFNWSYRYLAPDPAFTGEPSLGIRLEPLGEDHSGSNVLLHGSVLQALGFDASKNLTLQLDPAHVEGSSITRADYDGDNVADYRVWVPHFSPAWIGVSTSMGTPRDIAITSTTSGFAAAGLSGMWVYDPSGSPAWTQKPMPTAFAGHSVYALDPLSSTEAWFAGGCVETNDGPKGKDVVVRLYKSGGTWFTESHNPSGQGSSTQSCPGRFFAIRAFSPSEVYAAGEHGIWKWNGASWTKQLDKRIEAMQFTSNTNGFALEVLNTSYSNLWRWNGASWSNTGVFRGATYTTYADMLTRSKDNAMVWNSVRGPGWMSFVNQYQTGCNCWQTKDIPSDGSQYDGWAIVGLSPNEAWSAGSTQTLHAAIRHYTGAEWIPVTTAEGDFSSSMSFYAMDFANRLDGWAGANNALYHYTGANSAPGVKYTFTPSSGDTTTTFTADARQTIDVDGDAVTYTWNWGDGTAPGTGALATHRYRDAGTYTVTLTATDSKGASTVKSQAVTVTPYALTNNVDLTMSFTATGQQDYYTFFVPTGSSLLRLTLDGAGGTNFNVYAKLNVKPTTSSFDVAGQASGSVEDARLANPAGGTYHVMVRSQSGAGWYTLRASYDGPPTAPTIVADPATPTKNVGFTLSGASSSSRHIYYIIDWGDQTEDRYPSVGTVEGGTPYSLGHTYAQSGTHVITVTAIDTNGLSASNSIGITVVNPPPPPPNGGVVLPKGHVVKAENVSHWFHQFRGRVTDLGGASSVNVWFEWGRTGEGFTGGTSQSSGSLGDYVKRSISAHPGVEYQVRMVVANVAGQYRSEPYIWTANMPPTRSDLPLGGQSAVEGDAYEWHMNYADVDNDSAVNATVIIDVPNPPTCGWPCPDNDIRLPMQTQAKACADSCGSAFYTRTYSGLEPGVHTYWYYACDKTSNDFCSEGWKVVSGDTWVSPSCCKPTKYALHILRKVHYENPVAYDPAGSDLPSSAWTRTVPTGAGPYWHVVDVRDHPQGPTPRAVNDPYALWFGLNETRSYQNGSDPIRGSVASPWIDLTEGTYHGLRFFSWMDTRSSMDTKRVYVEPENGVETLLLNLTGNHHGAGGGWVQVSASLNKWDGQRIRLRFEFAAPDGESGDHRGWFIDDLLVGRDEDGDGIPNRAEEVDRFVLNRRSWNEPVVIPPGRTRSILLRGIQQSFADSAIAHITVLPTSGATIVLNNSVWSTTIHSGGSTGLGVTWTPSGDLQVNLTQAGLDLKTLDKSDNFTLRVSAGSQSVLVLPLLMRLSGHTSPRVSDSDGDGLGDGLEWTILGSSPLSGDADNDGFHDSVDVRPFTPDQPPVVSDIQGLHGDWSLGLDFTIASTDADVSSVEVTTTDTTGQTHPWRVTWSDGKRWKIDWSAYAIEHAEARIVVTDSRGDVSTTILDYQSEAPSAIEVRYDAVVAGATAAGRVSLGQQVNPTAIGSGAAMLRVILLQAIEAGFRTSLLTLGAVQMMPTAGGGDFVTLQEPVKLYPTQVIAQYDVSALQRGCLQELFLLQGYIGLRGAAGITSQYPRYGSAEGVSQHIRSVFENGQGHLMQTTPQSAALLHFNTNLGVIERWDIHLVYDLPNPLWCRGEIVRQQDHADVDLAFQQALLLELARLGMDKEYIYYHLVQNKPSEERRSVHFAAINGDTKMLAGPPIEVRVSDEVLEAVLRATEHMPPTEGPAEGVFSYSLLQLGLAIYTAAVEQTQQPLKPDWYWTNPAPGRRERSPEGSFPSVDTFLLDDKPESGRDFYNDIGSVGNASRSTFTNMFEMKAGRVLEGAEKAVCARLAADTTPRSAYLPGAIVFGYRSVTLFLEVLRDPTQMLVTGGCDG